MRFLALLLCRSILSAQVVTNPGGAGLNTERQVFDVRAYGAAMDDATDDAPALQRAVDACEANGGGVVYIPAGVMRVEALTTINSIGCTVKGDGPSATRINNQGADTGVLFWDLTGLSADVQHGGGLKDLTINSGGATNKAANAIAASAVIVEDANGGFVIDHVSLRNHNIPLEVRGGFGNVVRDSDFRYAAQRGISVAAGAASAGDWMFTNIVLSNLEATGMDTAPDGIYLQDGGGLFFTNIDIMQFKRGFVIRPGAGEAVNWVTGHNVLADGNLNQGFAIGGGGGSITSVSFSNSWASFNGITNGTTTFSQAAQGVRVEGEVDSFTWSGGRIRENGGQGFLIVGGSPSPTNVSLLGSKVTKNSQETTNTYDGIFIGAGVTDFMIQGNDVGNFASSLSNGQRYGLVLDTGATDDFSISDNAFKGNLTGALADNSTGSTKLICDNRGSAVTAGCD